MYEVEKETKLIDGYKLKSQGIFNFEDLYTEMVKWFRHYGYEWKELEYKKVDNPGGMQVAEIRWECTKNIDNYVSLKINIFLKGELNDVEVTIGNEKKKMNKGSVEMKFTTTLIKNTEMWDDKPLGKTMALVYDKLLIKDRLDSYELESITESQKLISEVKEYLQIYAR